MQTSASEELDTDKAGLISMFLGYFRNVSKKMRRDSTVTPSKIS